MPAHSLDIYPAYIISSKNLFLLLITEKRRCMRMFGGYGGYHGGYPGGYHHHHGYYHGGYPGYGYGGYGGYGGFSSPFVGGFLGGLTAGALTGGYPGYGYGYGGYPYY